MKIDTQQLETMSLRGVRAAYELCYRDGLSFEEHFSLSEGSASYILSAAEEVCELAYEGKAAQHISELLAEDRDAIIVALRVVRAAQELLRATGWDGA